MKISDLPTQLQIAVKNQLADLRDWNISHQARYFSNHGFSSYAAYRDHLLKSYKVDGKLVADVVVMSCVQLLKRGYDFTAILPDHVADKVLHDYSDSINPNI